MFKSRKAKILIGFVATVVVGYAAARFTRGSSGVPGEFTNARLQGALIAQDIVNLSNASTDALEKVNELDKQGDYVNALAMMADLVAQAAEIRNRAVALSSQIEEMTKALSDINNFEARQAALESISNRLALMNQLITYSADMSQLLEVLQKRFSGVNGTGPKVEALVNQINTDVNAINNFNAQAGQAMDRFDAIVSK